VKSLAAIVAFFSLFPASTLAENAPAKQAFDSQGVKIQYTVEGKGEPVVLIHGLHANADLNWRLPGTTQALADHFRVISPDVRGHGGSDKPKEDDEYGVNMVEDVVRILDHLQIEQARIVGYSMGGMIAMRFAVDHPDRVRSVTLGGMGWLEQGALLQSFWERLPAREGAKTPSACARSFGKLALTEDELKMLSVPVAVLIGEHDPVRRLYVARLEKVRPDWKVTEIKGAGHITCIFKSQFKDELKKALELTPPR
jgi:pimeloyl-ACP methyl ester carboxylesterase